jgi:hypothetical protein
VAMPAMPSMLAMPAMLTVTALITSLVFASGCLGSKVGATVETPADRRLLIVTTEALYEPAQDYAAYREAGGFKVALVTTQQALDEAGGGAATLADALQAWVADWAADAQDSAADLADLQLYLLIIGDAVDNAPEDPMYVPVVAGQGGFVGDMAYGDLDGDGAPDLAIGRLPMRETEEVRAYLERVQQYENDRAPGPWNKRLSTFAGVGGFGPDIDLMLEYMATRIFESLTYDIDITMTYAAATSPYYLPHDAWDADYVERYNAGALFQPYIGHTLGWVDTQSLQPPNRRGFVAYLSCGDGEFQSSWAPVSALSDEMLLLPAGPVASLAASDWSHPYGNAILALEMSHALFNERAPTYGMALTWAKQRMLYPEGSLRAELDTAAEAFLDEPAEHLVRTHSVMYNLLGDPTLDPGFPPGRVTFTSSDSAIIGGQLTVTGTVTMDPRGTRMGHGEVTVTLECERAEIPGDLIPVDGEPSPAVAAANHATANDKVILTATADVANGAFELQLQIPATGLATGHYFLKGYALNDTADAMGSQEIVIRR